MNIENINTLKGVDPLAEDIANAKAIVYVGAGVSASAQLPDWEALLKTLKEHAHPVIAHESRDSPETLAYFETICKRQKNLEVADWLHDILEHRLGSILHGVLTTRKDGSRFSPSRLHQDIARIPFSLVLTTNYDELLEDALKEAGKHASVFDWTQVEDIVLPMTDSSRLLVLKTHGTAGHDTSLILSGRQYRKLIHEHRRFKEILKWIFLSKTCLFVGASLEDPDLLYLFHEAVSQYGHVFGPHYALLPPEEAPPRRIKLLLESLRINIIPLKITDAVKREATKQGSDERTVAASRFLTDLSGLAAAKRLDLGSASLPSSDDKGFYLEKALKKLLDLTLDWTASFRADFCLPEEGPGSDSSGKLTYRISAGPTDEKVKTATVAANSVCGIAYYKSASERGAYVKYVGDHKSPIEIATESGLNTYGDIEYRQGWPSVRSELAVPIQADGVRVGVLNIESHLRNAYSEGHVQVALKIAEKAGRLYATAANLAKRGRRLDPDLIALAYPKLHHLFFKIRRLRKPKQIENDLAFLVYQANYTDGKLRTKNLTTAKGSPFPPGCSSPDFAFDCKPSLVANVFSTGRPLLYLDAAVAMEKKQISPNFDQNVPVTGSIFAFPVMLHGHIAGVVEAWNVMGKPGCFDCRDIELLRRASHLLANASSAAHSTVSVEQFRGPRTFPNIELALRIVDVFDLTPAQTPKVDPDTNNSYLTAFGRRWQLLLEPLLRKFLSLLSENYDSFIRTHGLSPSLLTWMRLRKSRCWIRLKREPDMAPQFLMALQVSLDLNEPTKDRFEFDHDDGQTVCSRIASQPFGGAKDTQPRDQTRFQFSHPTEFVCDDKEKIFVWPNNRHQSFLLSRIRADRFSRVQRPNVLGKDSLATVLKKDPSRPWFVAPVVIGDESEWEAEAEKSLDEDRLVAYFTFESDVAYSADESKEEETLGDLWNGQQNDLLHMMDLFSACLAENNEFRELLKNGIPTIIRSTAAN